MPPRSRIPQIGNLPMPARKALYHFIDHSLEKNADVKRIMQSIALAQDHARRQQKRRLA